MHPLGAPEDRRIVLDDQDRGATVRELGEQVADLARPGGVELRGGLVEDQKASSHDDDAGDGDPLLLPARQRERLAVSEVRDPEAGQDAVDPRVHRRAVRPEVLEPEGELLANGLLRGRQLVGRRRKDDADMAEQHPGVHARGVEPADGCLTGDGRPDHPRQEPAGDQRQR